MFKFYLHPCVFDALSMYLHWLKGHIHMNHGCFIHSNMGATMKTTCIHLDIEPIGSDNKDCFNIS